MSTVLRRNRKGSDRDITRLNSLGFSLSTIAERLDCHPTSVTLRLKSLKIPPADTRRAFMEEIFKELPTGYQDDIADLLESKGVVSIKAYIRDLLEADLLARRAPQSQCPAECPPRCPRQCPEGPEKRPSAPAPINIEAIEAAKEEGTQTRV